MNAVYAGLNEAMTTGVIAGYPVVDVHVEVVDGSYHEVDSNENAFKMAAIFAMKDAFKKAKPIMLEPIMSVEASTPTDYQGDIMGDLNRRRGQIDPGGEPLLHHAGHVFIEPSAGNVADGTDMDAMRQEALDGFDIDTGGLEQLLAQGAAQLGHRLSKAFPGDVQDFADQGETIGVDAGGGEADEDIAFRHGRAVQHMLLVGQPHGEAGQIDLPPGLCVEEGLEIGAAAGDQNGDALSAHTSSTPSPPPTTDPMT